MEAAGTDPNQHWAAVFNREGSSLEEGIAAVWRPQAEERPGRVGCLVLSCWISNIIINRFFFSSSHLARRREVNFHERHNCVMDFYG